MKVIKYIFLYLVPVPQHCYSQYLSNRQKKTYFVASWPVTKRAGSGSVSQCTDPKHWFVLNNQVPKWWCVTCAGNTEVCRGRNPVGEYPPRPAQGVKKTRRANRFRPDTRLWLAQRSFPVFFLLLPVSYVSFSSSPSSVVSWFSYPPPFFQSTAFLTWIFWGLRVPCALIICSVADPGCSSRIWLFPSRIQSKKVTGSGIRIRNNKLFLSCRKYDPGCLFRIPYPRSGFFPSWIPDPRVKKAQNTVSGSATLIICRRKTLL